MLIWNFPKENLYQMPKIWTWYDHCETLKVGTAPLYLPYCMSSSVRQIGRHFPWSTYTKVSIIQIFCSAGMSNWKPFESTSMIVSWQCQTGVTLPFYVTNLQLTNFCRNNSEQEGLKLNIGTKDWDCCDEKKKVVD